MAERSKAPDSRDLRLRILVHECVRGFESHFCQEILHSREKSNFLLQANALDKVVIHAFFLPENQVVNCVMVGSFNRIQIILLMIHMAFLALSISPLVFSKFDFRKPI